MKDRRALIVLIAFLAVMMGGALAWKTASPSGTKVDSNHDAAPTTTTTPSTVPAAQVDWQPLLNRVVAGENALFQNPDPAKVGDIMTPTCTCYGETVSRLTNLKTHNWHVDGDSIKITTSAYQSGDASTITLVITPSPAGHATVDADGKVIEAALTGGKAQLFLYILNKGQDSVWRISDRHLLPEQTT